MILNIKKYVALSMMLGCFQAAMCQDDLSKMLDDNTKTKSDPVMATFKTTRLNMGHSVELVNAHHLDFRVSHVFGAMGKTYQGTGHNLYGFDVASNIRLGFEYGVNKNLTVAVGRSKGFGDVKELYDGYIKYKLLKQTTDNKMPLTLVLFTSASITSMKSSSDGTSETSFINPIERLSYATQALIARKFSSRLSLQITPIWIHRNFVKAGDENDMFAVGFAGRYKFTNRSAIIIDYYLPFSEYRKTLHKNKQYYNPLGLGYELDTGGHIFHLSLVNNGGFIEQDILPYSPTSWSKLGIRFGFNICRQFRIIK